MDTFIILIALSIIIIISHFLNIYSEKTGVPSVLILILFGALLQLDTQIIGFEILTENNRKPLLEILGVGGLILILLEAALELKINKTMISASLRAFFVAFLSLIASSFLIAYILQSFLAEMDFLNALLYATPLSIISSAIIIPSIQGFNEEKKSFLIYESVFSDVLGLLMFQVIIASLATGELMRSSEIMGKLGLSIIISIVISLFLIYLFQKIKGHTKLFLLFSVLILLYSFGEMIHLSSLLMVLIFGIILNNYKIIFIGPLQKIIHSEKVESIQDDFKVIIMESAFVVRTFFFILFGYYVSLGSLLNIEVIIISLVIFSIIYMVRFILVFPVLGGRMWPEVLLSPRGLITILLFFAISDEYICDQNFHTEIMPGVLLFIILGTALTMSNALIGVKQLENEKEINQLNDDSKVENLEEINREDQICDIIEEGDNIDG